MNDIVNSLISGGIILVFVFIIQRIFITFFNKFIKKNKNKSFKTILLFLRKVISSLILVVGFLLILNEFDMFKGFSVTALSSLGILTAILGLAAKESLNNFIGSLQLIISKPFEVGDFIKLPEKNISGVVEEISFRQTVIRNINNGRNVIPNDLLNSLIIENADKVDEDYCILEEYDISYSSDLDLDIKIIEKELKKNCINLSKKENIVVPKVRILKFGDSSIKLRAWIWGDNMGNAYENLYKINYNVKKEFEKNNIEIPYSYINVIQKKD